MSTTRVVRDVPESQLEFVVALMKEDGAQVTTTKQANGLWTVTGVFPDRSAASGSSAAVAPGTAARPPDTVAGRTHDVDVLARTIWGEARGGSRLGMEAVAAVVLNRLRRNNPARFGGTVAEVCLKPMQFSCWNADDPNFEKLKRVDETDPQFRICIEIAERACTGNLEDPTVGSDHYHTIAVAPSWSSGKAPVQQIDDHVFYNNIA